MKNDAPRLTRREALKRFARAAGGIAFAVGAAAGLSSCGDMEGLRNYDSYYYSAHSSYASSPGSSYYD